MPEIALSRFDAGSPLLEVALDVYGRTWPEDDPEESRASFMEYAGYRDFIGLIAFSGGEAVGVGYGACSYPGIWWHDEVAKRLGSDHPALQRAWRLVELAVDPEYQERRVGSQIHDALLAAQLCPRALIATGISNHRARAMYERRGWIPLGEPLHLPGKPEPHIIFGRECVT